MVLNAFVLFSLLLTIIVFSTFVIGFSNPVYSLLSLVSVFIVSALLLFLHGLDFIGFSLVIVYVGAIAILFLFVIMMLDIKTQPQNEEVNQSLLFYGLLTFFLLIFSIDFYKQALGDFFFIRVDSQYDFLNPIVIDQDQSTIKALGLCLYTDYSLLFLLAGLLLLVAMIGAIVLTSRVPRFTYSQDLPKQLATLGVAYKQKKDQL